MRRIDIALLLLALAPFAPLSAAATPSDDCLGCHSDAATVGKEFAVDPGVFDTTVHAELGCPSCHTAVDAGHPESGAAPSKANCRDCHTAIAQEYLLSRHHPNAVCSDCHNPHQVRGPTEVSGVDMNRVCSGCHELEAMATVHTAWLPQAELHIGALPCVSCHTAARENVITLYIVKRSAQGPFSSLELASYDELRPLTKDGKIETLIDLNADNYISLAELRLFNTDPERATLRLHGMMTPETVTHDFQILANRRDCTFCHASGTAARQTSFLSLANADGSYRRVAVERGAVLDALYGTPDFYMVGSTRSKVLDYVGGAIIACGLIVPIGHGTLRFLTRRNRTHKEE